MNQSEPPGQLSRPASNGNVSADCQPSINCSSGMSATPSVCAMLLAVPIGSGAIGMPRPSIILPTRPMVPSPWENVDVVLSGINLGSNLGDAMWHSGTLAAAKQASLLGLRGIALSTPVTDSEPDFEILKPWIAKVLHVLLPASELHLVNVNLPPTMPRGVLWTRQSVRHYDGKVVPWKDPMGREHYWFTVTPLEAAEEGTDRWAIERGYVSMTPLRLDLTDEANLDEAKRAHPVDSLSFG
ncbi:MAG: 5'/3'-nucleotidase SurE [Betaproteobacteria bacterium]